MNWTLLIQIAQYLATYGASFAQIIQDVIAIISAGGTPVVTSKEGALQKVKKATVSCCPDECCSQVDVVICHQSKALAAALEYRCTCDKTVDVTPCAD